MTTVPYILATAGHVDHGKSALVRALTGTDPDRLPEEKARGITIDLGFAHLELPSPPGVSPAVKYQAGIVDVPGHEDFVKNMVAGIGSIDLAVLVVAADDGWMPQTEEHLQILAYLGVRHGVVALTKIDLATSESDVISRVRERLRGSPFAEATIVPTSVVTGRGFDELKAALAAALAHTPPQRDVGKPRLAVDRAFALKGIGTVVTGTLTGGTLKRGQAAVVQPSGKPTRVRTVQTHGREVDLGRPGSRVALNLPDLGVDTGSATATEAAVGRGDVVTLAAFGTPGDAWDVVIERSARSFAPSAGDAGGGGGAGPRVLKDGTVVHVHHGSGDFAATVHLLAPLGNDASSAGGAGPSSGRSAPGGTRGNGRETDARAGDGPAPPANGSAGSPESGGGASPATGTTRAPKQLLPGERAIAQLRFESPVFAFAGDRFIVRDWPAQHTLAGGVVLDPDARRRGSREPARLALLAPRAAAPDDVKPYVEAHLARDGAIRTASLLTKSRFSADEVTAAVAALASSGRVVPVGGLAVDAARWQSLRLRAAQAVDALHKDHPDQPGLKLTDLRAALEDDLPAAEAFDALVADLLRGDFVRTRAAVRRSGHRPALPPNLQAAGAALRRALSAKPFEPPSRKELTRDAASNQALRFLITTGEAVEVGDDLVMLADHLKQATDTIRADIVENGPATVSELRQLLNTNRRVIVPLMEYLDRTGVTLRKGDERVLRGAQP